MKSASYDLKVEFDEKGNNVSTQRNDDTLLKIYPPKITNSCVEGREVTFFNVFA
jgi:hypothetical protein